MPPLNLFLRVRHPDLARFYRIADLATNAYRVGKWTDAETLALEGLTLAERFQQDWNYGNVIYNSREILGLLRLKEGKLEEAKQQLLAAGNTPGSPQLDSFGPRMILARELLERGEKQIVLRFLDLVARFWAGEKEGRFRDLEREHKQLINQWKTDIDAGRIPTYWLWMGDI